MFSFEMKFNIEIPIHLDESDRVSRLEDDLKTIFYTLKVIPEQDRPNIKVIDGAGTIHRYESWEQVKKIYENDGKIGLSYIGDTPF